MSSNVRLIILLLMTIATCNAHITADATSEYRALRNRELRSKSSKSFKSSAKGKGAKSSKSPGKGKGGKSSKSPGKGKGAKSSKSPGKGKGGKSSKSNKSSKSLKSSSGGGGGGGGNKPAPEECENIQGLPCDDNTRRYCEIQQIVSTISDNVPNQVALDWLLNEDTNTNSCGGVDSIIQRYSLAVFFYETDGPNWKNKDGWLNSQNECTTWRGIECNTDGRVTKIILGE